MYELIHGIDRNLEDRIKKSLIILMKKKKYKKLILDGLELIK
jgi:hypothetical protein